MSELQFLQQRVKELTELLQADEHQLKQLRTMLLAEEQQALEWKKAAFQGQEELETLRHRLELQEEEKEHLQHELQQSYATNAQLTALQHQPSSPATDDARLAELTELLKEAQQRAADLQKTNFLFQEDRQKLTAEVYAANQELAATKMEVQDLIKVNTLLSERLSAASTAECLHQPSSSQEPAHSSPPVPSDGSASATAQPHGSSSAELSSPSTPQLLADSNGALPATTVARLNKEKQLRETLGIPSDEPFCSPPFSCKRQTGPRDWPAGLLYVTQNFLCWQPAKAKHRSSALTILLHRIQAINHVGRSSLFGGQMNVTWSSEGELTTVIFYLRKREHVARLIVDTSVELHNQIQVLKDNVLQASEYLGFIVLPDDDMIHQQSEDEDDP